MQVLNSIKIKKQERVISNLKQDTYTLGPVQVAVRSWLLQEQPPQDCPLVSEFWRLYKVLPLLPLFQKPFQSV